MYRVTLVLTLISLSTASSLKTDTGGDVIVTALFDHEAKIVLYRDPSVPACFIQQHNYTLTVQSFDGTKPDELVLTGRPWTVNGTVSRFQKEFCSNLPLLEIEPRTDKLTQRRHRVHRARRRRDSRHQYSRDMGQYHFPGSQTQVDGRVEGTGQFSGQAQSTYGGLSQSQLQLGGVGLTGSMSSMAGGTQSGLRLGSRSGSGQISSSGNGATASELQLNLGEPGQESRANAMVMQEHRAHTESTMETSGLTSGQMSSGHQRTSGLTSGQMTSGHQRTSGLTSGQMTSGQQLSSGQLTSGQQHTSGSTSGQLSSGQQHTSGSTSGQLSSGQQHTSGSTSGQLTSGQLTSGSGYSSQQLSPRYSRYDTFRRQSFGNTQSDSRFPYSISTTHRSSGSRYGSDHQTSTDMKPGHDSGYQLQEMHNSMKTQGSTSASGTTTEPQVDTGTTTYRRTEQSRFHQSVQAPPERTYTTGAQSQFRSDSVTMQDLPRTGSQPQIHQIETERTNGYQPSGTSSSATEGQSTYRSVSEPIRPTVTAEPQDVTQQYPVPNPYSTFSHNQAEETQIGLSTSSGPSSTNGQRSNSQSVSTGTQSNRETGTDFYTSLGPSSTNGQRSNSQSVSIGIQPRRETGTDFYTSLGPSSTNGQRSHSQSVSIGIQPRRETGTDSFTSPGPSSTNGQRSHSQSVSIGTQSHRETGTDSFTSSSPSSTNGQRSQSVSGGTQHYRETGTDSFTSSGSRSTNGQPSQSVSGGTQSHRETGTDSFTSSGPSSTNGRRSQSVSGGTQQYRETGSQSHHQTPTTDKFDLDETDLSAVFQTTPHQQTGYTQTQRTENSQSQYGHSTSFRPQSVQTLDDSSIPSFQRSYTQTSSSRTLPMMTSYPVANGQRIYQRRIVTYYPGQMSPVSSQHTIQQSMTGQQPKGQGQGQGHGQNQGQTSGDCHTMTFQCTTIFDSNGRSKLCQPKAMTQGSQPMTCCC